MAEHITLRARRVLRRAWADCNRYGLALFADGQFLGILRESTCVAARLLKDHGLDLRQARRDVLELAPRSAEVLPELTHPSARGRGWGEAIRIVQSDPGKCMDTPYFLLGVLEADTTAARVLDRQGVSLEAVKTAAAAVCGDSAKAEGGTAPFHFRKSAAAWLEELQDPNPKVRLRAAMTLSVASTIGEVELDPAEAVPVLSELLRDPEVLIRMSAADALGDFGPAAREAVPALRRALEDQEEVRARAAEALALIDSEPTDVSSFEQALRDPSLSVRVSAAAGLWNATHRPERVLPALLEGLESDEELVRTRAAEQLGQFGPAAEGAVPALAALLTSGDAGGSFGGDCPSTSRMAVLGALAAIGPAARGAVPALVGLLRDGDLILKGLTCRALSATAPGAPELLSALVDVLHDPRPQAREAAAMTIGQLGPAGRPAAAALREALADAAAMVRVWAASALGKVGQPEPAVPVLVRALAETEEYVAATAAGQLGQLGPAAAGAGPALRQALASPDPVLRTAAAGALWKITGDVADVLPVLTAALAADSPMARHGAVIHLGEMGPAARAALPELLAALGSADQLVRRFARDAVSKITPEAAPEPDEPVVAAAPSPDVSRLVGRLQRGGVSQDLGQQPRPPDAELADWDDALRLDPDDAQAYRCRAEAHQQLGDLTAAARDLDAAIVLEPEDDGAFLARGIVYLAARDYDRAITDFDEFVRRQPDNVDGYNQRGIAHKRRGDFTAAVADYTAAIRLNPTFAPYYLNRSMAFKAMKAYGRAIADLEEALRLDPEYANGHNNLAWYRATCPDAAARDGAEAVRHAERACALSGGGNPILLSTLAAAHAEAGDFAQAVRWAKEAVVRAEKFEPEKVEEFTGHLRLYERGRPFREG